MRGRPSVRPRGRAAVGWCVAAVAASQLALAVVQERWRPDLRDPEYGHKLGLLRHHADDRPLLLALGSSRTVNGLRLDVLPPGGPRVFNFGLLGHGPVRQALTLDRLLRGGVRPRWVTVECPVLFLPLGLREFDRVPAGQFSWDDLQFLRTNGLCPTGYMTDWAEARAAPSYASRFVLMSRLLATWLPGNLRQDFIRRRTLADGWAPLPETQATATERESVRTGVAVALADFRIAPEAAHALRLTLERCRAEGIPAAVLLMPEATSIRALLPPAGERAVQTLLAGMSDEFGVPVIDARRWCHDDDFRDGHHLLPGGAKRFTERFGREVEAMLTGH